MRRVILIIAALFLAAQSFVPFVFSLDCREGLIIRWTTDEPLAELQESFGAALLENEAGTRGYRVFLDFDKCVDDFIARPCYWRANLAHLQPDNYRLESGYIYTGGRYWSITPMSVYRLVDCPRVWLGPIYARCWVTDWRLCF